MAIDSLLLLESLLYINAFWAWVASALLIAGGLKGVKRSDRTLRNASWVFLAAGLERSYIALGFTMAAAGVIPSASAGIIMRPGLWIASIMLIALLVILRPWGSHPSPQPPGASQGPEAELAALAVESVEAAQAVEAQAAQAVELVEASRAPGAAEAAEAAQAVGALAARIAEAEAEAASEEAASPPGPPEAG